MKKSPLLFFLFLFSFQLFADNGGDEKLRLAVMDIETSKCRISKDMVEKATEYLRGLLLPSNKYFVIPPQELKERLAQIKEESYSNSRYDDDSKSKLGKALSADTILRTRIMLFDEKYTVTSELIDLTKEGTVKGARAAFDKATEKSLKKALDSIAAQIISNNEGNQQSAVSAKELKACQKAREDNRPSSWNAYLDMYPNGFCALEAKKELDSSLCKRAQTEDTLEMWKKYSELHPDGECEFEARSSIRRLEHQKRKSAASGKTQPSIEFDDNEACEDARAEDTEEAWQKYLNNYPHGECEFDAKSSIRRLRHSANKEKEQRIEYLKGRKIGNLIWSDSSPNGMRWGEAKQYCENLTDGGYDDWRLPNNKEFRTRLQNDSDSTCTISNQKAGKKIKKTGNCVSHGDDSNKWYWSNTPRSSSSSWIFNLSSGGNSYSFNHSFFYVLCVRQAE
ncbi:DUF1566 domain-containing protein [bacterium]|nr:DUF1566 domain-containing protein [bacterium]